MKLSLILLLVFSCSSWANEYRRGNQVCTDLSEKYYKEDSEDISNQYMHASCLVIKGQDAAGLPRIYHLSDHNSHIPASLFLGNYLGSDGQFNTYLTETKIDEAIKYYFRTLALIDLNPGYPRRMDLDIFEYDFQAELKSAYQLPILYLHKYRLGVMNDSCIKALQYGYKGECPTHHGYESTTRHSLNEALIYARECASLPKKKHFRADYYQAVIKSCGYLEELVLDLIPLEEERLQLLLREDCKDPLNCEDYMENYDEIAGYHEQSIEKARKVFEGA